MAFGSSYAMASPVRGKSFAPCTCVAAPCPCDAVGGATGMPAIEREWVPLNSQYPYRKVEGGFPFPSQEGSGGPFGTSPEYEEWEDERAAGRPSEASVALLGGVLALALWFL